MFREIMKELNFTGDEPEWERQQLYEKITHTDLSDKELASELRAEKQKKQVLATEIYRQQELLRQVCDLDHEKTNYLNAQIAALNNRIDQDKERQKIAH